MCRGGMHSAATLNSQLSFSHNTEGRVMLTDGLPPLPKTHTHRFSAQSGNDLLERRWRDGSLELDLPVQVSARVRTLTHC